MVEKNKGFSFTDGVSSDRTDDYSDVPSVDPWKVDWADDADVRSLADLLTARYRDALAGIVGDTTGKLLDGSPQAGVLTLGALSTAVDELVSSMLPPLMAGPQRGGSEWVAPLFGYETLGELEHDMPDIRRFRDAALKAKATGEPVIVQGDWHDATVSYEDGRIMVFVGPLDD